MNYPAFYYGFLTGVIIALLAVCWYFNIPIISPLRI